MIEVPTKFFERSVCGNPRWLLYELDLNARTAHFAHMSRRTFEASSFFDERLITATPLRFRIKLDRLLNRYQTQGSSHRPACYIFNSAFCGSTLLARSLDRRGACLAYKEPIALAQLCSARPVSPSPAIKAWKQCLRVAQQLLSKTFDAREVPLIKATDFCSFIMSDVLEEHSDSQPKALFLYTDLRTFLCSVLPSAERRSWARNNLAITSRFAARSSIMTDIHIDDLNDPETATYLWLCQMYNYLNVAAKDTSDRVRSLNFDLFLDRPEATLTSISDFFELAFSASEIQEIAESDAFNTYSKPVPSGFSSKLLRHIGVSPASTAQKFDRLLRARILLLAEASHAKEISHALDWAQRIMDRMAIPNPLPKPLVDGHG